MLQEPEAEELYGRLPLGYGGRFYGVYPALVSDIKDPDGSGRVQVELPWCPGGDDPGYKVWARIAMLMAGSARGTWFIPEVNDEVLVSFEGGDPRKPYVLGMLWNGQDKPPEQMDADGKNNIRSITSRGKVKITIDDTEEKEQLILQTPSGHIFTFHDDADKSYVELKDKDSNTVHMDKDGIKITDTNKNSITMNKDGMIIEDDNKNKITKSNTGIKIQDVNNNAIVHLDSGKVHVTDNAQDKVDLDGGTITVANSANNIKVAPSNIVSTVGTNKVTIGPASVVSESTPAKLTVAPQGVAAELVANSVKVEATGVSTMAPPAMLKVESTGIQAMYPPSILKLGPDGVSIMSLRVSVQAAQVELMGAMVSLTAPFVQVAGVLQCATLITSSVVAGAYTPGGGNIL